MTTEPTAPEPPGSNLTKFTANLTPATVRALDEVIARRGGNKSDAVNTAVQIMNLVTAELAKGRSIATVNEDGEIIERWRILITG